MLPRSTFLASRRALFRKDASSRLSTRSRLTIPNASSRRLASTRSGIISWAQSNSKVSSVFTALILLGVASTAYGVYEFYQMFTVWPKEVRADLRAGIKARNQGDFNKSAAYIRRALETAHGLPLEAFAAEPYLKLSGIAVVLGEVLEKANKPQEAYEVYSNALSELQQVQSTDSNQLSGPERVRAAALAYKLGTMAEEYQQPEDEEEKWLTFAVEELLRVVRDFSGAIPNDPENEEEKVALSELDLPAWVKKQDLIAPLERLGAFYSRTGKHEYAVPIYLSALSILTPSRRSTVESRCQGAHLMNSLADTLTQNPTPERRKQAEVWVRKALNVIREVKTVATEQDADAVEQCEQTLAATLFNLGSLREMSGDGKDARRWYTEARKQSQSIKLRDGVIEADIALRRLDKQNNNTVSLSGGGEQKK